MEQLPIIIAGAGPTGLLSANLLGQYGVSVVVLEEDHCLSQLPKAVLLDDNSLRSLQAIGLYDAMIDKIILGYGSRYINKDGRCFMEIGYEPSEQGYPKRNAFSQPDLEEVLLQGLERYPHVTVHMNTKVIGFEQDDKGVSIVCEQQGGKKVDFRGCLALACDGGKSTLRKLLDVKMEGPAVEQDWLVIDLKNDADNDRFTKFWCGHERAYLSIPQPNNCRRYEYLLLDGEDRNTVSSYESVKKLLAPIRDVQPEDVLRSTVYTFHALVAEHMVVNRVMLLGDAAHLTPPFAGQGLNAGLRDALSACWRAALVALGEADVSFLASYHEERHDQCRDMIDFALNLGKIMMPKDEFDQRVTERLFNMLGLIPEARDYVYNMKFKPPMHLRAGFKQGTFGLPFELDLGGKKVPQPCVKLRDGSSTLLDNILGSGFCCVGLGLESGTLVTAFDVLPTGSLGMKHVVLLLAHEEFPDSTDDVVVFAKLSEAFLISKKSSFLPRVGEAMLVRPDHYCFAEISQGKQESVLKRSKCKFDRMQQGWD